MFTRLVKNIYMTFTPDSNDFHGLDPSSYVINVEVPSAGFDQHLSWGMKLDVVEDISPVQSKLSYSVVISLLFSTWYITDPTVLCLLSVASKQTLVSRPVISCGLLLHVLPLNILVTKYPELDFIRNRDLTGFEAGVNLRFAY